ncbi:hypothetical protein L1049_000658 [Liquidambar formosana]|uniref:Uncharacterized protein n=1 Tax=Liquidambar formosana TaxID=63359 RepID=A0AAP0N964_LIQFO
MVSYKLHEISIETCSGNEILSISSCDASGHPVELKVEDDSVEVELKVEDDSVEVKRQTDSEETSQSEDEEG